MAGGDRTVAMKATAASEQEKSQSQEASVVSTRAATPAQAAASKAIKEGDWDRASSALKTAEKISSMSQPIVTIAKDCVNAAFESSLAEGLRLERALFYSTFATADQKIGMQAFIDKAEAKFKDAGIRLCSNSRGNFVRAP